MKSRQRAGRARQSVIVLNDAKWAGMLFEAAGAERLRDESPVVPVPRRREEYRPVDIESDNVHDASDLPLFQRNYRDAGGQQ